MLYFRTGGCTMSGQRVERRPAPQSIHLSDLPTEMLLTVLERLVKLNPVTLLRCGRCARGCGASLICGASGTVLIQL